MNTYPRLPVISFPKALVSATLAAGLLLGLAPLSPSHASQSGQVVVGAFPAPPKGAGSGRLTEWKIGKGAPIIGHYGVAKTPSGNSFYVAYNSENERIYVPTFAGTTYVLDAKTLAPVSEFKTIPGGRIGRIGPDHKTLLVLSGKQLAVYALGNKKELFRVPVGGNALAINTATRRVYVGGNMSKTVSEIDLASGKILRSFPIIGSGDLAMVKNKLFSANMKTGVMSMLDTQTGKITPVQTDEIDPDFSYRKIPAARAGFMQMAVSPDQKVVYVVGFSGNILKFSATDGLYLGKVAIKAAPVGANKLSGFAIVDNGKQAVVTIENRKESALIRLSDGKILNLLKGTASNRWVSLHP